MRKKIVAGNWKMNLTAPQAQALVASISAQSSTYSAQVIVCPPFPYLSDVQRALAGTAIQVGAQNIADREHGAFTGEVSAPMLASMQLPYILIGHSERRAYYHETHEILLTKLKIALDYGLTPIFCCGEPREVRVDGHQEAYVLKQLEESLLVLGADSVAKVIIAYEPVWAIGTGLHASPEQAQEMHQYIRAQVRASCGASIAAAMPILYGGSVNAGNAASLFAQPDVDGGLVGGASLKAEEFITIIQAAS
jgi:triosephosphate isomerase (TIM)